MEPSCITPSLLLDKCGFKYGGFDKSLGIRIKLSPDDDPRISQATSKVRQGRQWFWSNAVGAEHAVRACCRIRLLNTSYKSRNDYEGMDRVDIDASSTKPWIDFVKGLNTEEDRRALSIWRSGAIHTQTRFMLHVSQHNGADRAEARCMHAPAHGTACHGGTGPQPSRLVSGCLPAARGGGGQASLAAHASPQPRPRNQHKGHRPPASVAGRCC